jgi:hypothetical protein
MPGVAAIGGIPPSGAVLGRACLGDPRTALHKSAACYAVALTLASAIVPTASR